MTTRQLDKLIGKTVKLHCAKFQETGVLTVLSRRPRSRTFLAIPSNLDGSPGTDRHDNRMVLSCDDFEVVTDENKEGAR